MRLPIEQIRVAFESRLLEGVSATEDAREPTTLHELGTHALKVSTSMSPRAHRILDGVRKRLGVDSPVAIFRADSNFDNATMYTLTDGLAMHFAGSWLDTLPDDCLAALMGHELGHHLCDHKYGSRPAIEVRPYRRACELTADRFAVIAAGLDAALRLSMLATVGAKARIELDTAAYLDDCRAFVEACTTGEARATGDQHPETRIRAYAKFLFAESDVHRGLTNRGGGPSLRDIDAALESLLACVGDDRPSPSQQAPAPMKEPRSLEGVAFDILVDGARRLLVRTASSIVRPSDAPDEHTSNDVDPLEEDRRELEARFQELERRERES